MTEEKQTKTNPMREIKIEKVVLNIGGVADYLERGIKLLEMLAPERKVCRTKSRKRIPSWSVRPGLEVGAVVTFRKDYEQLLKRLLATVNNTLKKKQVSENNFSFGIKEYIEIPGAEYKREIGIMGFDVTVVFKRSGERVREKKIKKGKVSKKQIISKEEIIKFMEENFQVKFI